MEPIITAILNFVDTALNVVVLLVLVLGFALKGWISGTIKAYFQSALGKELEDYRHNLRRDLEAYKASTLREFEQFRANIDIRRSIALQFESAKLDACRKLAADLSAFFNAAVTFPVHDAETKKVANIQLSEYLNTARAAYRNTEIFLPLELNGEISSTMSSVYDIAVTCLNQGIVLKKDDPKIHDELLKIARVELKLRKFVEQEGAFVQRA